MRETTIQSVAWAIAVTLIVCACVAGGQSCVRMEREAFNKCVAAGEKPAECAMATGARR